ncbi:MAG: hypothetical protein MAG581_01939 [Deltaproteobacteria bacterium]|nr:hypothetical protein [Deltaproteobacteria bacterium]
MTMYFAGFAEILAAPALPNLLEITQPNGAKFKAYLRGDEYFSWWESEKGTVLFRNLESGYFEYAKISMIDDKEKLVSTGVIFVAGEETSVSSSRFSKMTKLNLSKIWMQKREDARKRLQEILEKQKQSGNQ